MEKEDTSTVTSTANLRINIGSIMEQLQQKYPNTEFDSGHLSQTVKENCVVDIDESHPVVTKVDIENNTAVSSITDNIIYASRNKQLKNIYKNSNTNWYTMVSKISEVNIDKCSDKNIVENEENSPEKNKSNLCHIDTYMENDDNTPLGLSDEEDYMRSPFKEIDLGKLLHFKNIMCINNYKISCIIFIFLSKILIFIYFSLLVHFYKYY